MNTTRAIRYVAGIGAALALSASGARAQTGPLPPCGAMATSAYPDIGVSVEKFWRSGDVSKDWQLPACVGWSKPAFSTIVTTLARFHYSGDAESILRRIGAVSELTGVRYWSPSHGSWQTLIVASTALAGPSDKARRGDFSADEVRHGTAVYFEQSDNLLGKAVYRLTVTEASPDRIVFNVENVASMKYSFLTLFDAGEMQTIHYLVRESPDVWRYYGIMRTGSHTNGMVTAHPSSSINRAVAFFRHYAGIPTDQEPPGAKDQ